MADDLREAMRQARRASGLPFKTFARVAGFSESHLRSVENGTRALSIDIAAGYDKALGTGDTFAREFGEDDVNRRGFLGLAAVLGLDPGSRTFGRTDVELLHEDFDRLRDLDSKLGGADTYRLYAAELARTETVLTKGHCSDQVRTALIKLLAEQLQQAGWAAFDGGADRTALALFEHSRLAAEKVSADDLAANALILTAYVAPNDPESDALNRSETYRVTPAVCRASGFCPGLRQVSGLWR